MTASVSTHTATSLSEFIVQIKSIIADADCFHTYRGERDVDWQLVPSIMRPKLDRLLEHERDAIRELISIHPNEFASDQSMFDRLVRMQHFGLPTRLLDVTGNPLVALFNATEEVDPRLESPKDGQVYYAQVPKQRRKYFDSDTISCISNLANLSHSEKITIFQNYKNLSVDEFRNENKHYALGRLLQFIRAEKPSFRSLIIPEELDTIWYVVPKLSNRRIVAQNGAFIIFGLTPHAPVPTGLDQILFRSIRIPSGVKGPIRTDLEKLGITNSSLFPEIDKAASYIIDRYRS